MLEGVIGHEKQIALLERDLDQDNLAQAYLFSGARGLGKFTAARSFAERLQGRKINFLDTIELVGEETIKIKEMREVVGRMSKTGQSEYKILLIKNIERMTIPAANSFLKFLEEPEGRTVFLMTTSDINRVLPTIISRLRVVNFGPVEESVLRKFLAEKFAGVEAEELDLVTKYSLGRVGAAVSVLSDGECLERFVCMNNQLKRFLDGSPLVDRFAFVEKLHNERDDLDYFFELMAYNLRSRMLAGDEGARAKLIPTLSELRKARNFLEKNVNFRLVLENLMLAI